MSRFSRVLRARRRDLDVTHQALADDIGVSKSAVIHFEQGRATPTLAHLYLILHTLELTPNQLLGKNADDYYTGILEED